MILFGLRGGDRRRQRQFGEGGASAVEAAIVTPIVMAMLFGIIELGFLFKDYLAAAGAVRAGVRMASAMPRNATFAQAAADQVAITGGAINFKDVQELWIYKVEPACPTCALSNKPVGFSSFSGCTTCVKFRWDTGLKEFVRTGTEDWAAGSQNACSTSTQHPDRIGVYIRLRHDAFTGLIFNTVTISETSIMSLEPISFLKECKP
jgi:hypothetical protein